MKIEEFAICMKRNMDKKKLSLQDISELTGISISRLNEYESGVFKGKSNEIILIAKALDVPPAILIQGGGMAHFSSMDEKGQRTSKWDMY